MKLWRYGQPVEYLGRRYRLDGMLGSGGMADVCLAWDEREQREVALKILKSDDLDQETLNRFMKEAAQIAHWQHPHILRVYESLQIELIDAASGSVLFYMVSEYARGGDLQKRLAPGRAFPLSASFALFRQLCDAVQYAHERGVIHRDLKPLNILFRRPESGPEQVVLSDFGLAVQVDASHHTFAHGGTLAYMAPEQFQGHALPASDLFALGVILYLLCTGSLPFRRSLQDMQRVIHGQAPLPTRPALLNPELPPALDEVILRALRELPAERYRQPRDFWQAIELVLTTNARTFPFNEEWQGAGQTWPDESAHQAGQFSPAPARMFPEKETLEGQEGSDSALALWIAREKQKASPVRLPLPTSSIPALPNPAHGAAPGGAASDDDGMETPSFPAQPGDYPPASHASATWQPAIDVATGTAGTDEPYPRTERPRARANRANAGVPGDAGQDQARGPGEPAARRPREQRPAPGEFAAGRQAPAASASGSTILPAPRASARDPEQTSRRRQPFAFDAGPQTSRRQPSHQLPASSGSPDDQSQRRAPLPPGQDDTFEDVFTGYPRRASRAGQTSARRQPVLPSPASPAPARSPRASSGRRVRRIPLIAILSGLALSGLLIAIFAATSFQGNLLNFFGAPVVKVTLQPRAQLLQQDQTLTLVSPGGGQLAPGEIPGRQLSATSPTQSTTASATGSTKGKRAIGQLTFINNGSTAVTIPSSVITGNSGIPVTFAGPITIPALNPSFIIVNGFAVDPGTNGNIPQFDIVKNCCGSNIVVKNSTAFTGGQDVVQNGVIQQKDIDGAASGLVASGQAAAREKLQGMLRANERVLGNAQCQPRVSANQQAGNLAKQVTVQMAVTCSETVYDADAARQALTASLQHMESADPTLGAAYALDGQIAFSLVNSTAASSSQPGPALQFHAQGLWVYQFTAATLRGFASLIAGKSLADARTLLLRQPGVSGVQFSTGNTLPVNTGEIQVSVQEPPAPA